MNGEKIMSSTDLHHYPRTPENHKELVKTGMVQETPHVFNDGYSRQQHTSVMPNERSELVPRAGEWMGIFTSTMIHLDDIIFHEVLNLSTFSESSFTFFNQSQVSSPLLRLKLWSEDQCVHFQNNQEIILPTINAQEKISLKIPLKPTVWTGGNLQSKICYQISNVDGSSSPEEVRSIQKILPLDRSGSLHLFDANGMEPIEQGIVPCQAGEKVSFRIQFNYQKSFFSWGPFSIIAGETSAPGIINVKDTPIQIDLGSWDAHRYSDMVQLTYYIPSDSKNKTEWVTIYLLEGKDQVIHALRINLQVK